MGTPTPAGVDRIIAIIAASGFNTLFLQVDSWYTYSLLHPEYEPRNPLASFDALSYILRRGGAVRHSGSSQLSPGQQQKQSSPTRCGTGLPGCRARQSRLAREILDDTGQIVESQFNVCPSRPPTRAWEVELLGLLVERYPSIACFQFEEPGYDSADFCVCEECRRLYREGWGAELVDQVLLEARREDKPDPRICRNRRGTQVSTDETLLGEVRERLAGSGLLYSSTISYNRWRDRRLGRDWVRWAGNEWLRFVSPMIYVSDSELFSRSLELGVIAELDRRCSVCPGIGLHFSGSLAPLPGQRSPDVNSVEEVVRQIELARLVGRRSGGRVSGVSLFLGEYLRPQFRDEGVRQLAAINAAAFRTAVTLPSWLPPPGLRSRA